MLVKSYDGDSNPTERCRELADGASQTRNGGVNITPELRM